MKSFGAAFTMSPPISTRQHVSTCLLGGILSCCLRCRQGICSLPGNGGRLTDGSAWTE